MKLQHRPWGQWAAPKAGKNTRVGPGTRGFWGGGKGGLEAGNKGWVCLVRAWDRGEGLGLRGTPQ